MATNELERFIELWDREAAKSVRMLEGLPRDQYDFRPDAEGRSVGELAWHLCEGEAYVTYAIEKGSMSPDDRPPGLARPRTVEELAPGYARIHRDAVERVRKLAPEDLDRKQSFFGTELTLRDALWDFALLHNIHHRGQLGLMCRLAGGTPSGVFGPTREESRARRAEAAGTA